jgi:hypothetical protein
MLRLSGGTAIGTIMPMALKPLTARAASLVVRAVTSSTNNAMSTPIQPMPATTCSTSTALRAAGVKRHGVVRVALLLICLVWVVASFFISLLLPIATARNLSVV